MRGSIRLGLVGVLALACAKSAPSGANPTKPAAKLGPRLPLTPPAMSDVETWCARVPDRPFARCVVETSVLVLGSPIVLTDPGWIKSGRFGAACAGAKNATVCSEGARVTCTDGVPTDAIACATMDMVCSPSAAGVGECVRAACFIGPRVQCFAGFLDACNDTKSETTRGRCPNDVPCRDDGAGGFTCAPSSACDETTCENGVAHVCVAGEPRAVHCQEAGWDCPRPGLPGLPPAPCALPTTGEVCPDDHASCEGTTVRYCLKGHARRVDCANVGKECRDDATLGAHCE